MSSRLDYPRPVADRDCPPWPRRSAPPSTRYGPLFRNLVRREVRQRYKGSVLGLAWTLITPAVMVAAYSLVFKFLLRIDIPNYALFLFVGLTIWTFFLGGAQLASQQPRGERRPGDEGEVPARDRPAGRR